MSKQKGGDGYVVNVNNGIAGIPTYTRYSNNYRPIFEGELLKGGSNSTNKNTDNCDCNKNKSDPSVFDLIKQNGGNNENKLTQFDVIKEVSNMISPLEKKDLNTIITKILVKHSKFIEKDIEGINQILVPLGHDNRHRVR